MYNVTTLEATILTQHDNTLILGTDDGEIKILLRPERDPVAIDALREYARKIT